MTARPPSYRWVRAGDLNAFTVIGGIDNTESAIAAGDDYRTRDMLLTEAVATVAAGVCGGVIQNTPYIGHPAYKAMGAVPVTRRPPGSSSGSAPLWG